MSLQQMLQLLRALAAGGIRARALVVLVPAFDDRVDPGPRGLHLVAAHKQRRVTFQPIQQQTFIGEPVVARVTV
jgi:hypothetical protein